MGGITDKEFEKVQTRALDKTEREEQILNKDSLFQMDISAAPVHDIRKGARVFWKSVQVTEYQPDKSQSHMQSKFYEVRLDGKRVRAFEGSSQQHLLLPTQNYAYAVAREWASQTCFVNQTTMPLSDISSAACYHVGETGIPPRIDYLISFLRNDNTFYRSASIAAEQDNKYNPIHRWFEKTFETETLPRVVGLKYCSLPEETAGKIHAVISELNLNTYQIIALCVLCQYTSSLILPLAHLLTNGELLSTKDLFRYSSMEEDFNRAKHGQVVGYHDFREKEARLKVSAAICAWQLTNGLSHENCIP